MSFVWPERYVGPLLIPQLDTIEAGMASKLECLWRTDVRRTRRREIRRDVNTLSYLGRLRNHLRSVHEGTAVTIKDQKRLISPPMLYPQLYFNQDEGGDYTDIYEKAIIITFAC